MYLLLLQYLIINKLLNNTIHMTQQTKFFFMNHRYLLKVGRIVQPGQITYSLPKMSTNMMVVPFQAIREMSSLLLH